MSCPHRSYTFDPFIYLEQRSSTSEFNNFAEERKDIFRGRDVIDVSPHNHFIIFKSVLVLITHFNLYICDKHILYRSLHCLAISRSSQCSTTGVTKAVVCVILSVGWCI